MNKNEEIIPKHISIINKAKIRNNSKSIESRNKENEINISKGKSVSKDIENFVDLNQEKEVRICLDYYSLIYMHPWELFTLENNRA